MAEQKVSEQRWQDWLNLILGVWLIVAPFFGVGVHNDAAAYNSYISGAVVAILAIAALSRTRLWEEWLNLIVGLWLIVAPFALQFTGERGHTWNQIIVGLIVGIDALWAAMQIQARARHA
jgi:hypothetical protein